jgi:asparaginyl-tRNA synthetase
MTVPVRAYVDTIGQHEGQEATIKGWLYNKTDKGKLQFLLMRDGTGTIQAVAFQDNLSPEAFEAAQQVTQESSIVVTGTVRADQRAPGGYELSVTDFEIVQLAEPYPITPKEHGVGFLMDHRHLWLRSARQHAILKIRAEVIRACRDYFDDHGFVLVDTPILTPAACEGTSTLFETDYFGESAYLAQSGQLYSEAAIASLGKVYCFGPTFRAEKSKTRRHLLEFWMVEPEMAFADLDDCMELAEGFVTHIVQTVLEKQKAPLEVLERDTTLLEKVEPPFPRMTYDEAVGILRKKGLEFEWGSDFGSPDETALAEEWNRPVLVHRFPTQCKAFYMEPDPDRSELSLSVDCLAPEGYGEIVGGGQRIADHDLLLRRIREHHLPEDAFRWYLDLRRYGSTPHSGFGLGIERTVAWICGLEHIRETIPFPRMLHRLYP